MASNMEIGIGYVELPGSDDSGAPAIDDDINFDSSLTSTPHTMLMTLVKTPDTGDPSSVTWDSYRVSDPWLVLGSVTHADATPVEVTAYNELTGFQRRIDTSDAINDYSGATKIASFGAAQTPSAGRIPINLDAHSSDVSRVFPLIQFAGSDIEVEEYVIPIQAGTYNDGSLPVQAVLVRNTGNAADANSSGVYGSIGIAWRDPSDDSVTERCIVSNSSTNFAMRTDTIATQFTSSFLYKLNVSGWLEGSTDDGVTVTRTPSNNADDVVAWTFGVQNGAAVRGVDLDMTGTTTGETLATTDLTSITGAILVFSDIDNAVDTNPASQTYKAFSMVFFDGDTITAMQNGTNASQDTIYKTTNATLSNLSASGGDLLCDFDATEAETANYKCFALVFGEVAAGGGPTPHPAGPFGHPLSGALGGPI
jgi:hypothetical protein